LSGAGKSVLLKHMIGLLKPDAGAIFFRGKPLNGMKKTERDGYLRQISFMFQNNALFDSMTVFENVALPLQRTTNLKKKEIQHRAMVRIEQTELADVAHKYPTEISGGMQKRAALARALVTDPKIVLFDEPTTGQDPIRKNAILGMIARYKKKFGFTAVLISHEIPDVFFISNRILALYDKRIVFQGSPEELEDFDHPFMDEVVHSLEGLQEELTGLYSKRHFKVRYQTSLSRRPGQETYAVVVFALDDLDVISEYLGHVKAQQILRAMGSYIDKHFTAVGGFSTRFSINEVVTVLPYSDLEEAGRILEDFARDFQERGIHDIVSGFQAKDSKECIEITISAGLAQGKPSVEVESILRVATSQRRKIAAFECESRG
jgi:phospholipid/cholesterol/gamma-HCH transport system ATP-binding protein